MNEMIGVRLSLTDREVLEKLAKEERRTISEIARHILHSYLHNGDSPTLKEVGEDLDEIKDMVQTSSLLLQESLRLDIGEEKFKKVVEKVKERKAKKERERGQTR